MIAADKRLLLVPEQPIGEDDPRRGRLVPDWCAFPSSGKGLLTTAKFVLIVASRKYSPANSLHLLNIYFFEEFMRYGFWSLIFLLLLAAAPREGVAAKKLALVIGNSAYKFTSPLENPKNDAEDLSRSLTALGYQVFAGADLDKSAMDKLVRDFAGALVGAEVGVFFYAGHGIQVNGQNYLVPVDAELATSASMDFELVRLDLIQRTMEREAATNIIFLDACRNNPLARNLQRSFGTRSIDIGRGLASVESGQGTLISFSTQPGNVALDGTGRNSPFAEALLRHIAKPGEDLSSILIKVRTDVIQATARSQVPWEHSSLTSRFYFSDREARPDETAELVLWEKVKDSLDPDVVAQYTNEYPQGTFAVLARTLVDALKKQKEATAKAAQTESQQRSELERARQEVKKAQSALQEAEKAKKGGGAKVAARTTGTARFDGTWRVIRLSQECKRQRIEFIISIKDGVASHHRGNGKVTTDGSFNYTSMPEEGATNTLTGTMTEAGGTGTSLFRRGQFTCGGTFTLSKLE
jgi:hypothetical protein